MGQHLISCGSQHLGPWTFCFFVSIIVILPTNIHQIGVSIIDLISNISQIPHYIDNTIAYIESRCTGYKFRNHIPETLLISRYTGNCLNFRVNLLEYTIVYPNSCCVSTCLFTVERRRIYNGWHKTPWWSTHLAGGCEDSYMLTYAV